MSTYYLETSALMKRYKSEVGSEVVEEIFDRTTHSETLVTSHLTVLEVNAVAARLLKGRVIIRGEYQAMLGRFSRDIDDYDVIVIPVQSALVGEAIGIVGEHHLRTADALHFASMMMASRAMGGLEFYVVSADREILEACGACGISAIDPESDGALEMLRSLR